MSENDIKKALGTVLDALCSEYDKERQEADAWKKLFSKSDGLNFKAVLREAACQMETIALDAYDIIERELNKVGNKPNREIFNIIYALPYLENALAKVASKTEGSACSIDKAFYILNEYINKIAEEASISGKE